MNIYATADGLPIAIQTIRGETAPDLHLVQAWDPRGATIEWLDMTAVPTDRLVAAVEPIAQSYFVLVKLEGHVASDDEARRHAVIIAAARIGSSIIWDIKPGDIMHASAYRMSYELVLSGGTGSGQAREHFRLESDVAIDDVELEIWNSWLPLTGEERAVAIDLITSSGMCIPQMGWSVAVNGERVPPEGLEMPHQHLTQMMLVTQLRSETVGWLQGVTSGWQTLMFGSVAQPVSVRVALEIGALVVDSDMLSHMHYTDEDIHQITADAQLCYMKQAMSAAMSATRFIDPSFDDRPVAQRVLLLAAACTAYDTAHVMERTLDIGNVARVLHRMMAAAASSMCHRMRAVTTDVNTYEVRCLMEANPDAAIVGIDIVMSQPGRRTPVPDAVRLGDLLRHRV